MLFFWTFYSSRILNKCIMVSTKIWSCFNTDNNVSWAVNQHMNDFWRSCDTEDWRNDAENTLKYITINYILLYIIHIENSHFKLK